MRPEWTARAFENLRPLASLFSEDLAIDLGTVNTRVYARGRGIVVNEPSAVAIEEGTGEVRALGKESHAEKMLAYFIQKAHQRRTLGDHQRPLRNHSS